MYCIQENGVIMYCWRLLCRYASRPQPTSTIGDNFIILDYNIYYEFSIHWF